MWYQCTGAWVWSQISFQFTFSSVHFDLITHECCSSNVVEVFMQALGPTSGGWWWLYVHSLHTSITEHLVLHNEQVSTECLLVQLIGMILVGQVEQHLYKRQGWLVQRYNALHSCNTKFGSGMCMYNTKTHTCAHIHVHKHAHTHKHTHTSTAHTHTHSHICTHPYTLKTLFQVGCRIC